MNTKLYPRMTLIFLMIPTLLSELIDAVTDMATYSKNIVFVHTIISYPKDLGFASRDITSLVVCKIIAVGIVVFHASLFLLVLIGLIKLVKGLRVSKKDFSQICRTFAGILIIVIFLYMFIFGVVGDNYFLAIDHGLDMTLPILGSIFLPAIALLYIQRYIE